MTSSIHELDLVKGGLGLLSPVLGALQLALELLDTHYVGVGDALLLLELPLVHLDLLVEFVQRLLQDDDVLAVFPGLEDELLDLAGLDLHLSHGGGVALLLDIDHLLKLSDSDLHLLDGPLAGGDRVGLNLLDLDIE